MCSFLSEVLLEAGKSGLLQACRAGPRAGQGCQRPASRGLQIPTQEALWKTKCPSAPPRKGVHGDEGGRQPWCSRGFGFFNRICMCVYVNSFPFFSYFRVNLDLQKSCDDNADSSYILQKKICSTINILHMYSVFDTINCPRSIAY